MIVTKKHGAIFAVIVLALILVISFGLSSRAGLAKFYAGSCLGGWQNPQAATGEPDGNSATLTGSLSEIFCGNFQGEVPADTAPKHFQVKFAWLIADGSDQILIATTTISTNDFTDKTVEILNSDDEAVVELTVSDAVDVVATSTKNGDAIPDDSEETVISAEVVPIVDTPPIEPDPVPEPTPAPTPEPALTPAPEATVSWWRYFIDYAVATTTTAKEILEAAPDDKIISPDDWLEVFYTLDSETWHSLGRITKGNWQDAELDLPIADWADLSSLQISVRSLPRVDEPIHIALDSVWLEVDYGDFLDEELTPEEIALLPRVELPATEVFLSTKNEFRASETPGFILNNDFPVATSTPPLSFLFPRLLAAARVPIRVLKTSLYDPRGQSVESALEMQTDADTINLNLNLTGPKTGSFRPGKYQLTVEILQGRRVIVSSLEFYWGVLVINANKSVYAPNEDAYLQMAALDDNGRTICDADLSLEITGPNSQVTLSTVDETISRNNTCDGNNVTDEPDYFVHYQLGGDGVYRLRLTNLDNSHQITDALTVRGGDNFQIERIGATRINPFLADYVMRLKVRAEQVFSGLLTELIPAEFEVNDPGGGNVGVVQNQKTISWPLALAPGETRELFYEYRAPKISPLIHLLGPANLEDAGATVFTEGRQWQLAADAAFTSSQSGNWNDGATWGNTSPGVEGTDYPGASDTATIVAGHTVTLTADHAATNVTIDSTGTLSTDNGSRNLTLTGTSGTLLTRNGTFTAGNSTVTVTSASGSLALGSVGGITYNNLTINATATSINSLTLTVSGNLNIQAGLFNAAGTLTGPGSGSGTFTIASGATFCLGGTNPTTNSTCNNGSTIATARNMPTFQTYSFDDNSTVIYNTNVDQTISNTPTYGNLTIAPRLSANRVHTFGGAVTIDGDLKIIPVASSASRSLTVNAGGTITVASGKTTTIQPDSTNSPTATFSTNGSSNNLSTGKIIIDTNGTLNASSTITLTGTSGTLLTRVGTFTESTSEVAVTSASGSPTLLSAAATFYKLTINSSATVINAGAVITMNSTSGNKLYLQSGTLDDGGNTIVGTTGDGTLVLDSGTTLKIGLAGTASTFPTNYLNASTTLNAASTVVYQAGISQNISGVPTYGNLTLTPLSGTPTYTLTAATTLNGGLTISSGATLDVDDINDYALTIKGNWANSGTFTAREGTVTLSGTSAQALSGTMIGTSAFYNLTLTNSSGTDASDGERTDFVAGIDFNAAASSTNNFTITTASVRVEFQSASGYTFQNINWNGQAVGTRIFFRNSAVSGSWLLYVPGTRTALSYVNVSRSDASGTTQINASDGTNVDSDNNTNWLFVAGITVSGTAYATDETTPITSKTVALRVNGVLAGTGDGGTGLDDTDGSGNWSITDVSAGAGDTITIYLTGETETANTLTISDGSSNITGVPLYDDHVILRSDNGATAITNADLADYDNDDNTTDLLFTANSGSLVVESGNELHILSGETFAPGGNVSTPNLEVKGTYTGASETLTLDGTSGTLLTNSGTFTASANTVSVTPNAAVTLLSGTFTGTSAFNVLSLTPAISTGRTYTMGAAASTTTFTISPTATAGSPTLTVNLSSGGLSSSATTTLTAGDASAISALNTVSGSNYPLWVANLVVETKGTLTLNSSTLTLTGPAGSTLLTRNGTGSFSASSATTTVVSDASITLTSGTVTFGNLNLAPTLTANRTYTSGISTLTVSGNLFVNPSAASALRLTLSLGAALNVSSATNITTITGTGSALSTLDTTSSNHAFSTGFLTIASAGTLTANASTITLSGASDTALTNNGTFNIGTSTIVFSGNGSLTLSSGVSTFYNLQLAPNLGFSRTYTFGSDTTEISNDLDLFPSAVSGSPVLTANLSAALAVIGTTTISGNPQGDFGSPTSVLNTTASDYDLTSGHIDIATRGTLTANNSTIILNGTSGTLLTVAGTFNADSSLVSIRPDASVTLFIGDIIFYDLSIEPTITAGRDYLFGGGGNIEIANDFVVNPTASSETRTLTVNDFSTTIFYTDVTATIKKTGTAVTVFDVSAATEMGNFGSLTIETGASLLAGDVPVTVLGDFVVAGTYTAANGSLDTDGLVSISSGGNLTAPTDVTSSPSMYVAGNFSNSGTFTHNSGTVQFNGTNQTVTGASTFFNLKKLDQVNGGTDVTLTLPANATTTVTGRLTLTGTDSNDRVKLVSSSPGTRAGLTVSGTFSLNCVFPADNDASLGVRLDVVTSGGNCTSTDGGNNLNWNFDSLALAIDGATEAFSNVTPNGSVVATSSILTVKTSNHTGFVITAYRSDGTATMNHNTYSSLTLSDKTAWVPNAATTSAGNATASTTESQTLQFRVRQAGTDTPNYASAWWGSDDTTANALFAGFPSSAQNIAKRSTAAAATTTVVVLYNLAVSATQASGDYAGDVVYEATVNP